MKLKGLKPSTTQWEALQAALPPAVAETTTKQARGRGAPLQVMLPDETLRALKHAAVDADTTVRALVLLALQAAGYPVPEGELGDRRRG